jgi:hypothetical protein
MEHRYPSKCRTLFTGFEDGIFVAERLNRLILTRKPDFLPDWIPAAVNDPDGRSRARLENFSAESSTELAGTQYRDNQRFQVRAGVEVIKLFTM